MNKGDTIAKESFPNAAYSSHVYLFCIDPALRGQRKKSLGLLFSHRPKLPIHFVYSRRTLIINNDNWGFSTKQSAGTSISHSSSTLVRHCYFELLSYLRKL